MGKKTPGCQKKNPSWKITLCLYPIFLMTEPEKLLRRRKNYLEEVPVPAGVNFSVSCSISPQQRRLIILSPFCLQEQDPSSSEKNSH